LNERQFSFAGKNAASDQRDKKLWPQRNLSHYGSNSLAICNGLLKDRKHKSMKNA
jgi:hypothetical protein